MDRELLDGITEKLCYTDLVYGRINKKLGTHLSNQDIEAMINSLLVNKKDDDIIEKGKNYYIYDKSSRIRLTINKYTVRVITADLIEG